MQPAREERSQTSLRYGEQFSAAHKQIYQCTGNEQSVRVLLQSAIAHFHESKLQLHDFANAEVNVATNQRIANELDRVVVPDELRTIWKEFADSLSFTATFQQRRLEYLRTGNLETLMQPIGEIEPSIACANTIKRLSLKTTLIQRYEVSLYGWQNCVSPVWNRNAPQYPNADWQVFLQDYGITEQFSEKAVD